MPAFHLQWTVLPHGPLEPLADNLWRLEGDLPDLDFVKRVMTIARRENGALVVHNAIALEPEGMAQLDALGPVRTIVVPNGWHRLDARSFHERYPEATVVCPRGAVSSVQAAVPAAKTYEDFPADDVVTLGYLPGVRPREGVMTVRSPDGVTVVLNDLVNNLPRARGLQGFLYQLLAGTGRPGIHRMIGLMLVRRRRELRAELRRLADDPALRRVVVSHGAPVLDDAAGFLRRVAG